MVDLSLLFSPVARVLSVIALFKSPNPLALYYENMNRENDI